MTQLVLIDEMGVQLKTMNSRGLVIVLPKVHAIKGRPRLPSSLLQIEKSQASLTSSEAGFWCRGFYFSVRSELKLQMPMCAKTAFVGELKL